MPDDSFLRAVGLHVPELISGFAGGLVKVLFTKGQSPLELIAATIGGALTSNYLSEPFSHLMGRIALGGEQFDLGVSGFVVGLTAMTLCQAIIARVGMWAARAKIARRDV